MAETSPNSSAQTPIVIGTARDCMMKEGKWKGRSTADLAAAVSQVMQNKRASTSGTVATLCISPTNGCRLPCDSLEVKQSIVGDAQSKEGWTAPESAKCKNEGLLLGDENLFLESLLASVSIGDEDLVHEVVCGSQAPRLDKVWATGDNIYVSGLDMSWNNFRIGDLLVTPGAVIVNTGYPHFACWKYGVRAGDEPKNYINSKEGTAQRMRGIKGAVLLPSTPASGIVNTQDVVSIVRKGSQDYKSVVESCRPPLEKGTQLAFCMGGHDKRVAAHDTQAYIDLLICAGTESGKIDANRYSRDLPDIAQQELGLMPKPMEISDAAKSGDGTTENVGIKINGVFACTECRQRFDDKRALQLHWKFIHDPNRHQED